MRPVARAAAAVAVAAGALVPAGRALACVFPDCILGVVDDWVRVEPCQAYVRDPVTGERRCVP